MELIFILSSIIQSIAISLGVGCSTVAIVNFFVAISDGEIDASERRMMAVTYTLLRIAMVVIFLSTLVMSYISVFLNGSNLTATLTVALWTLILVLFVNAILMTKHLIPSTIGPGIQASAWYTLGITTALPAYYVAQASLLTFFVWYLAFTTAAVLLVYILVKRSKKSS